MQLAIELSWGSTYNNCSSSSSCQLLQLALCPCKSLPKHVSHNQLIGCAFWCRRILWLSLALRNGSLAHKALFNGLYVLRISVINVSRGDLNSVLSDWLKSVGKQVVNARKWNGKRRQIKRISQECQELIERFSVYLFYFNSFYLFLHFKSFLMDNATSWAQLSA